MSAIARLLEQATPGPWEFKGDGMFPVVTKPESYAPVMEFAQYGPNGRPEAEANARLIALAPDMARLLIDMAAVVGTICDDTACADPECPCSAGKIAALLARFAELEQRAAP